MQRALAFFVSLMLTFAANAEDAVSFRYKAPESQKEAAIKGELEVLLPVDNVVRMLNDVFIMPRPLSIIIGGDEGPLYDMESNEILLPYRFINETKAFFTQHNYQETGVGVQDATMDVMLYVLLHQIAHAMISLYDYPTLVGREETAADELTTVLLLEFFDDGTEVVISAADLVDMRSRTKNGAADEDFWEGHYLLGEPRYYRSLCNVYGSNPKEYPELLEGTGITQEGAKVCVDEYQKLVTDWSFLLGPYIKDQPEQPAETEQDPEALNPPAVPHSHATF